MWLHTGIIHIRGWMNPDALQCSVRNSAEQPSLFLCSQKETALKPLSAQSHLLQRHSMSEFNLPDYVMVCWSDSGLNVIIRGRTRGSDVHLKQESDCGRGC